MVRRWLMTAVAGLALALGGTTAGAPLVAKAPVTSTVAKAPVTSTVAVSPDCSDCNWHQ